MMQLRIPLALCLVLIATTLCARGETQPPQQDTRALSVNEKLDRILELLERLAVNDEAILEEVRALRQAPTAPDGSAEAPVDLLWRTSSGSVPDSESGPARKLSPWRLRSFAASSKPLGSKQLGTLQPVVVQEIPPVSLTAASNNSLETEMVEPNRFQFDMQRGPGLGFELERLLGESSAAQPALWGWTVGLSGTALDSFWMIDSPELWIRDHDHVPMFSLTTGLNRHWRRQQWDFFAGPVLAWLHFDDSTYADSGLTPGSSKGTFEADFDSSFAFGANLGLDLWLGGSWGLTTGVQYLDVSIDSGFLDVAVNPLTSRFGLVYNF